MTPAARPCQQSLRLLPLQGERILRDLVVEIATIIGAAIIIAAGIYIFLREQALGKQETAVNPPA